MNLIALDLDGTLLNSNNEISNENIEAIKYAQSKGIEVTIATGRSYFDALSICERAGISTYIIGCNGSTIHSPKGEQLHSATINKETASKIIKWLEENNYYYEVITDNELYAPINAKNILKVELDKIKRNDPNLNTLPLLQTAETQFNQTGFTMLNNYAEILKRTENCYKILGFSFNQAKRKTGINLFNKLKHLSVVSSGTYNFEVTNKNVSKGNSLQKLSSLLNISLDNTMAIGDSHNDISMLKKVGYNVSMGNAHSDIKKLCTTVTSSNNENGVADAIYEFINTTKNVS